MRRYLNRSIGSSSHTLCSLDSFSFFLGNEFIVFNLTLLTLLESSDLLSHVNVVVEVGSEGSGQVVNFSLVFLSDIDDGNARSVLLVAELTEFGGSPDEAVRNVLSSAKGRHPENELNWVNIGGDGNEFGLLLLDEAGNVVKTELEDVWLLLVDWLF